MKKSLISIFITCSLLPHGYSQTSRELNLDFEQTTNGYPTHWENFGSEEYKIFSDSSTVKNGKFSAVIENNSNISDYKALAMSLPQNYEGKEIRLTGYIKTENVANGYAGLWMRIAPQVAKDEVLEKAIEFLNQ